jgi:hypothetical protein
VVAWIEQRIEEELKERGDSQKSFRAIGRELAAEIERIFEAKVNPRTLANKAGNIEGARNRATAQTPRQSSIEAVDNVDTVDKPAPPYPPSVDGG